MKKFMIIKIISKVPQMWQFIIVYISKNLPSHICMYSVMLVFANNVLQVSFANTWLCSGPPSGSQYWQFVNLTHTTLHVPTANFKFSLVRTRCLPYSCVKGTVACDFWTLAFFMNKYLSNQDSPNGIVSILVPISHRYLKI